MEFKDILGKVVRHVSYKNDDLGGYFLIKEKGIVYNYSEKKTTYLDNYKENELLGYTKDGTWILVPDQDKIKLKLGIIPDNITIFKCL